MPKLEDDSIEDAALRRTYVIGALEEISFSILRQIANIIQDCYPDHRQSSVVGGPRMRLHLQIASRNGKGGTKEIWWPKRKPSARYLGALLRVVDLCHYSLHQNVMLTKREIFYQDIELFGKQRKVDDIVDDLAATLRVSRSDLNVVASPKGMVSGSIMSIKLISGTELLLSSREGSLIPPVDDIVDLLWRDEPGYVLVVEKEAVFQTLCNAGFADNSLLGKKGVIITGKGQPDVVTRSLVYLLGRRLPTKIPILLLVDADVYGLEIASVYTHGSIRMRHEADSLVTRRAIWLGLKYSDLRRFNVNQDLFLQVSDIDHKKALHMLSRPDDVFPKDWKTELSRFVLMRRKAEIEVLSQASNFFSNMSLPVSLNLHQGNHTLPANNGSGSFTAEDLWKTARSGPALIPYLLIKISEALGGTDAL